jgi:hypothetical protein
MKTEEIQDAIEFTETELLSAINRLAGALRASGGHELLDDWLELVKDTEQHFEDLL